MCSVTCQLAGWCRQQLKRQVLRPERLSDGVVLSVLLLCACAEAETAASGRAEPNRRELVFECTGNF